MLNLNILQYGSEQLNNRCKPVKLFNSRLRETAKSMAKLMAESKGIGLSANQVGLDLDMFVMFSLKDRMPYAIINPQITYLDEQKVMDNEGCLSFKDVFLPVARSKQVEVRFQDLNGIKVRKMFYDIDARCVLHEMDHLNGITFVEKFDLTALQDPAILSPSLREFIEQRKNVKNKIPIQKH